MKASSAAFSLLLQFAKPERVRHLFHRAPDVLESTLSGDRLPVSLVDAIVVADSPALERLLHRWGLGTADDRIRARLTASGHPLVATNALNTSAGTLPELRALLAAADPTDPRWYTPAGPASVLLAVSVATADPHRTLMLRAALVSPFPGLVTHALREHLPGGLTRAERLQGVLSLLRHGGPTELADLLESADLERALGDDVGLAQQAMAGHAGVAALEAAAEAAAGPAGLVTELSGSPDNARHALSVRETLDWDDVLAAHAARPFAPDVIRLLVTRADCPAETLAALCAGHPHAAELLGELGALDQLAALPRRPANLLTTTYLKKSVELNAAGYAMPWAVLAGIRWTSADMAEDLSRLLSQGIEDGRFPIDRVLAEVRPARQILNCLPHDQEPARRALADLVRPLGADFAAWHALYTVLPRFAGSSTELVAAALARAPRHQGKAWPNPQQWEIPVSTFTGLRKAFLRLLEHADPAVQRSVLPHLDNRSIQHLLIFHDLDDEVREHIVRIRGAEALYAMAASYALPSRKIDYLLGLDDPKLNAWLYRYARLSATQRRDILLGKRHQTGQQTEPLPLADELVRIIKEHTSADDARSWLLPIAVTGDPRLIRLMLGRIKPHTPAAQLLLLVRLWERHGPTEVVSLLAEAAFPPRPSSTHPLSPETHGVASAALVASDGLDQLRKHLDAEWSPAGKVAFLRSRAGTTKDKAREAITVLTEETDWELPWEALIDAHRHEPLPDSLLVALAEKATCPTELREAGRAVEMWVEHPTYSPRRRGPRPSGADLLRRYPVQPGRSWSPSVKSDHAWVRAGLTTGHLTPLDILQHAHPAQAAATMLVEAELDAVDRQPGSEVTRLLDEGASVHRHLRELVATHLGDDPEAWAVAVRLLPEFTGTIPELLATAAAVTVS